MSVRDSTVLSIALLMGAVAVVMHVLSTEAPTAHLPEGALLLDMVRAQLIAFEAIGELGFASSMSLA